MIVGKKVAIIVFRATAAVLIHHKGWVVFSAKPKFIVAMFDFDFI